MKIAILANNASSFIKPMAIGLQIMLKQLSVQADIFDIGLAALNYSDSNTLKIKCKNTIKSVINLVQQKAFALHQTTNLADVKHFESQLNEYDAIIVVCNIPDAFERHKLHRIESIREKLKIPIILYQNYYLATRGAWSRKIIKSGGFGLERFDWYLAASVSSIYSLSQEPHPCSVIGHDLTDNILKPNNNKSFKVLLDFKRKGFEHFRALQIQALEQTNTPYTQLCGTYSQAEIKSIYQQHSALFLSFKESFGLPIIENQLCGNYIFTPFNHWVSSHYIKKSVYQSGEGLLGDSFIVYNNDLQQLKNTLIECENNYNSEKIYQQFKAQYPQFYQGDLTVLKTFIDKLNNGEIHANSHQQYLSLNKGIVYDGS
jgi:hypothetical protein